MQILVDQKKGSQRPTLRIPAPRMITGAVTAMRKMRLRRGGGWAFEIDLKYFRGELASDVQMKVSTEDGS